MHRSRPLAIGMLSGGLDSSLALALVQRQGVDVIGVNFSTGFCLTDHHRQIQRKGTKPEKLRNEALRAGADFGIPVEIIDVSQEYLDVLRHPRHGYGRGVNPCIDCRILMLRRTRELMEEKGAAFVFTGEVLGQRPKSQTRRAMNVITEECGLGDRLVRPLSARLLAPTAPEREGILDRERLLALHGRDRNPQFELAREWGVTDYPQPAGGCCSLPDPAYAALVFDLFQHEGKEAVDHDDLLLCKVGRHFRVSGGAKVVVGRFEEENAFLRRLAHGKTTCEVVGHRGPLSVVELGVASGGTASETVLERAARICARYSDGKREARVTVRLVEGDRTRELEVAPFRPEECEAWMLR